MGDGIKAEVGGLEEVAAVAVSEATGSSVSVHVSSEGKNKGLLLCLHCPSKIMEPLTASFVMEEKTLPKMSQKKERTELEMDKVSEWFVVEDIMQFENIGVSHAVEQTKYLTCADCEMGPVGWTDLGTKRCFIALSRVRHVESGS